MNDRKPVMAPWSPEMRQAIWFWIFWSIYVCLSAFLITVLLTDWPAFLHEHHQYFR
jgi:hypothetical protein